MLLSRVQSVQYELRVAVAIDGIHGQASVDDVGQFAVHAGRLAMLNGQRRFGDFVPVSLQTFGQVGGRFDPLDRLVAAMRRRAGQHAIQQCPQRVNVPSGIRNGAQICLLGSHVEQRPQCRRLLVRQSRLAEIGKSRTVVLI